MNFYRLFFAILLLSPSTLLAEECVGDCDSFRWGSKENPIYTENKNLNPSKVEKWCNDSSSEVRYVTAGIHPKGYEPCGEVQVETFCDALGNKIISRPGEITPPHGYKSCDNPPEITMMKDGMEVDIPAALRGETALHQKKESVEVSSERDWVDEYYEEKNISPDTPMTAKEFKELDQILDKKRNSNNTGDPLGLQQATDAMLQHVGGLESLLDMSNQSGDTSLGEQVQQIQENLMKRYQELEKAGAIP